MRAATRAASPRQPLRAPTRTRASRARRRRRARSRLEPVADAPDRLEMLRVRWIALELFPQAPDVHRDGARVEHGLIAPDARHQLVAGEDPTWIGGEEVQQVELL